MDDASALTKPLTDVANVTILMIQKDVCVRAWMSDELREQGYVCIEASTADEALDVLHSHARIDLVLTGRRLLGTLDVGALARLIRAEFPLTKILMASGESPDPSVHEMLDAYVRKPFSAAQLIRAVQALAPAKSNPVLP